MFDPLTARIISSSPPLSGLDLDDLPKRLTEAYADIIAARIMFRSRDTSVSERLAKTLAELRRLAATYEAYVTLLPQRENRAAAAFVAASAHQAILISREQAEVTSSFLEGHGISPEISASLLFLVADAHADAAESVKRIVIDSESDKTARGQLLKALKFFCQGHLGKISQIDISPSTNPDRTERAVDSLYLELLRGVRSLATNLLNPVDLPNVRPAADYFNKVKRLCSKEIRDVTDISSTVVSLFPGPSHLANLLLAAESDLKTSATTRTPTPMDIDKDQWGGFLRKIAKKRPFLWRNHIEAIKSGYLESGTSAVISFPTGGGKSTLAELKIACSLLKKKKVIFLAPTHALVDQTTRALKETFSESQIVGDNQDDSSEVELEELPEIIVTTPERCLMLVTSQPDVFIDLGLIVFDECHLLHPRQLEKSRRSVDAMLAILNLASLAKNADFLFLSAMMKNAGEISSWIKSLTQRPCLSLDVAWKPTRQARGCVVYPASRITELKQTLSDTKKSNPKAKSVPAKISRTLTARPFGFFSLLQTWATKQRKDYTLLELLPDEHQLATGRSSHGWHLTPNSNHISALISASSAQSGMKTLLFVQTIPYVESAISEIRKILKCDPIRLLDEELADLTRAAEELGGHEFLYSEWSGGQTIAGGAVSHHSLLLREERFVHESLFKRENGVTVLVATSTVAQGMNFPAEVVLISGDSRFDASDNKLAQLEAHELLNAAGRAGRAGENSQGFVLVIPSHVIAFDEKTNSINKHWSTLHSIFSQSDQCLDIDDPLTALLDQIHAGTFSDGMPAYLLSRLPPVEEANEELKNLLGRSFAVFRARQRGDEDWVNTRMIAAMDARKKITVEENIGWLDQVAGLTGVPTFVLQELGEVFPDGENGLTVLHAVNRLLNWLENKPQYLPLLIRPENLSEFFGKKYEELTDDIQRGKFALPVIKDFLLLWLTGEPLCKLESTYPEKPDMKHCKHARHFALRLVPDLAFVAGLPARIMTVKNQKLEEPFSIPVALETLASVVKEGCDNPESLAVRLGLGRVISRPAAYQRYKELLKIFPIQNTHQTFDESREWFRNAKALEAFIS